MDGHVGRARGEDESRPIERWREGSPHSNQRAREGQWERGRALGTRRAGQRVTPNVLLFDGDNHGVRPTPALAPAARATVDDSQSLRRSHRPVASVFAVRGVGSMRVVRLRRPCRSLYWDGRGLSIGGHLAAAIGAGSSNAPPGGRLALRLSACRHRWRERRDSTRRADARDGAPADRRAARDMAIAWRTTRPFRRGDALLSEPARVHRENVIVPAPCTNHAGKPTPRTGHG